MSIAALLQAAEFLERRERGKMQWLLFSISISDENWNVFAAIMVFAVESADFDIAMPDCCWCFCAILNFYQSHILRNFYSIFFRSWTWVCFVDACSSWDHSSKTEIQEISGKQVHVSRFYRRWHPMCFPFALLYTNVSVSFSPILCIIFLWSIKHTLFPQLCNLICHSFGFGISCSD